METEKILGLWMLPSGIEIIEVEYDSDMYAYEVSVDGRHVVTIFPATPEDTEDVRAGLDAGEGYTGRLGNGADGTIWEEADGIYYDYETVKDVMIGGL